MTKENDVCGGVLVTSGQDNVICVWTQLWDEFSERSDRSVLQKNNIFGVLILKLLEGSLAYHLLGLQWFIV